jgi:oxygen-independent coproporphyrinogen-3 oxidase
MKPPPLSLYVHLPWCVQKCPYCDFNSHTAGQSAQKQRYVAALLADLEREAGRAGDRSIDSVFLGGGTPSLFSPDQISRLLEGVMDRLNVSSAVEITMEANPGTVELGAPAGYRAAGVNRLSIGAQSFDNVALSRLGRIHDSDEIRGAVNAAVDGGFDNINIDLMHGLPGQTPAAAMADIRAAVELGPVHISWYQLTLEPNTIFHVRPPADLPDEETAYEIQDIGAALLCASGYEQYEVSAWARGGRYCRHNVNYWQFGDYLAVGAGAHGKFTRSQEVLRYRKPANPLQYMNLMETGDVEATAEVIAEPDLLFEFMLNALRLTQGFSEQQFVERTGLSVDVLERASASARSKGLLTCTEERIWKPTPLGRRFLNDLQSEFLPARC